MPLIFADLANSQNYERYKPLELPQTNRRVPEFPATDDLPKQVEDDRILVESLDAVVFVDNDSKIATDASIDSLEGIHYDFEDLDALVFKSQIRDIVSQQLGRPITLRRINELSRDIIKQYRKCKLPIVDVVIPEQRITSGTLHIVVIESHVGSVRIKPGCYFDCDDVSQWIQCTMPDQRIYEPWIEDDLLWMNQNPYHRVSVDFDKGTDPGTTDIIYSIKDVRPIRGYVGADDTGVASLNFGRFNTGLMYGNLFGRGGILSYQYTADQTFSTLNAHAVSYNQPLNRLYSINAYGSWAGVTPAIGNGLNQNGESWQTGGEIVRHLDRSRNLTRNLNFGYDFKSTNNNLEFSGSTVSNSNADLFQLRMGFEQSHRQDVGDYSFTRANLFVGPGGGTTDAHSTDAFETVRPGSSPDYVYGRLIHEESVLVCPEWQLVARGSGQVASERLLFSETLGLGGFDTIRGYDQRSYNADNGWTGSVEYG